jgi:hypothetical protein
MEPPLLRETAAAGERQQGRAKQRKRAEKIELGRGEKKKGERKGVGEGSWREEIKYEIL